VFAGVTWPFDYRRIDTHMTRIAHFVVAAILVLPLPALSEEPPPSAPAQALIEKTLAKHPEAAHIVLHVTPPGAPETDNVIIASNIGARGEMCADHLLP
jgi:hypothetical protein